LGLIINFSSAMLICELDDILFNTARVHNLKERFNDFENDLSLAVGESVPEEY
jgi:hypothetical protein